MELKDRVKRLVNTYGESGMNSFIDMYRFTYHFTSNEERVAFMNRIRSEDPDYKVCCFDDFDGLEEEDDYVAFPYLNFYEDGVVALTCAPAGPLVRFNIFDEVFNDGFVRRTIPKLKL